MNVTAHRGVTAYPTTDRFLRGHIVVWEYGGETNVGVVSSVESHSLLVHFWNVDRNRFFKNTNRVLPKNLKVIGYVQGWTR